MTHTYKITGMTCDSCQAKVQKLLENIDVVTNVKVDWRKGEADITMKNHISTSVFQDALKAYPKYKLSEKAPMVMPVFEEEHKSWFQTYKPVLLIFSYITGITLLIQVLQGEFLWMQWMNHFMAGFFLTFSFFKLLNLQGFADSYSTYDIIAKHWRGYGFLYVFIELGLGLAFLIGFEPLLSNSVAFVVMSISLVGVLQSVLNKRKIRCACLGDVFNLPMSTITIIEDTLMIAMSAIMLLNMI
ncbi:MAG: Heavy metal transport/detoxification protein [Bacteroidetes bacterium]|jgi:copper chaperone CopZ|nr:Heavy metal transport/detoxification protein [Bacteroidota bacterium]